MEHKFKKKFGQNFLQDKSILEKIVDSVELEPDDLVIEIGPGSGNLTGEIIKKTKNIICYEIDTELKNKLANFEKQGAKIIYDDFLNRNIINDIKEINYKNLYVISNLPYYITTPIIEKIIESKLNIAACVFMVQKEVANRFLALPNSRDYNSLTIFLNYYFEMEKIIDVSRNCFFPIPNVDSSVIKLKKRKTPYKIKDKNLFFKLVRDSFRFKRKTLKNNLKDYNLKNIEELLKKYNLDLSIRAEAIPIEIFIDISNFL